MPLIQEIAAKRSKLTIVLDEDVHGLADALRDRGFKVFTYPKGVTDEILSGFLEGRVLVTKNSKDFIASALVIDFDIISLEKIKFMDSKKDASNQTAIVISDAIRDSGISFKRGNWLMTLLDNGDYMMKELQ